MRNCFRKNKTEFVWHEENVAELAELYTRVETLENELSTLRKQQYQHINELRDTLIDLIHHLGLEEDRSYEPRRHVFRKRNAKREK